MDFKEENKTITINGDEIAPEKNKQVRIEIARLPSGTLIDIPVHVFNSKKPGPTVLIQAGLHGDEINGVETLRRLLQDRTFKIQKGAVIVVPILNIFGFIHFSRDVPDGKDVNRSFPGSKSGSLASRIAYHYTTEVLPQVDLAIDLHTGGAKRDNYPQIRYTKDDEASKTLAKAFGAPYFFASRLINGSFRRTMFRMNKPAIVYEAGESMRFDEQSIEISLKGIKNILTKLDILEGKPQRQKSIHLEKTKWIRASKAGMFVPKINNGNKVKKGQVLGMVTDIHVNKNKQVKAPYDGYVFCVNNQAVVNQGDALFHIGS
ncbi:succinylglutamate desuccinylase/aspartoacylase family protein [Allomuricauda sp. d1]|uniref:succinylglutamate desuccinylase/aspartoacylase family protein n=1 Tax=Allomuricauda sp. d1 TaxID=3136725 RepID=UPI0031E03B26